MAKCQSANNLELIINLGVLLICVIDVSYCKFVISKDTNNSLFAGLSMQE